MKISVAALLALFCTATYLQSQTVFRCMGQGSPLSVIRLMITTAHPDTLVLRAVRLDSAIVVESAQAQIDKGRRILADSLGTMRVPLRNVRRGATLLVRGLGYWAARSSLNVPRDSGLVGIAVLEPGMLCLQ